MQAKMDGAKIILLILTLMHVLPIVITQLLVLEYPFDGRENRNKVKWISTVANVVVNSFALLLVTLAYHRENKLNIIEVLNFECSYQDISRVATSNIICFVIAVLTGVMIYVSLCVYYRDKRFLRFSGKYALLFSFAAILVILGYYYGHSGVSNLAINEICKKSTVNIAEHFEDEDVIDEGVSYVVIVNNGIFSCELDQLYLSDNEGELQEKSLDGGVIRPGETYQHFMSADDSLNIKKSGTIVFLSDKFGTVIDSVEVPALKRNESYRNVVTGWQVVTLTDESAKPIAPSFSKESGFYDEAFELELIAGPETTIYYTIDSSNPTTESMKYSSPIYVYDRSEEENLYRSIRNVVDDYLNRSFDGTDPVDKCFVVRAVAVDHDGNFSDIVTKSYFINQERYEDGMVISLVSDPDGLFGDEHGICVTGKEYDEWYLDAYAKTDENGVIDTSNMPEANYLQQGADWERESSFEVFENAELTLAQAVGIRVQGHGARDGIFYKRFSIYAREEYSGADYFDLNLINEYSQHAMLLRQGDLYAICQMIGQGRDVATIEFKPVVVFLDGEFWYTTYLYEKFNETNFAQKYGLSKNNVVIVKNGEDTEGIEEGKIPYSRIFTFAFDNDLSDDAYYWAYSQILDIQSFIDSSCINIFMQNTDYQEQWNNMFWHTEVYENKQEGDTRWRLGLYDMDLGWGGIREEFGRISVYETNPFTMYGRYQSGPITEWLIYSSLRKNPIFCRQFVLTFMDLINTNFSVENTMSILEELGIEDDWYQTFFLNRIDYIVPYMAEEFELIGTQETVTLSSNISGTPITLNTISPKLSDSNVGDYEAGDLNGLYSWSGTYFTDYPVTVTADGPDFCYWEVTANGSIQQYTDETIEVPVSEGGIRIHAVFK